jgi:hypothetical protein
MRILIAVVTAVVLAGCATSSSTSATGLQTFRGEVWTWDTTDSTVTMQLDDGRRVRIQTSPDELRTLQLHQFTRVTGTLAPPKDLVVVLGPAGPYTTVARGQAETLELRGTVRSIEPSGQLVIDTERGPFRIWAAAGADQRFKVGEPVSVTGSVQPVELVTAPATAPASAVVAPAPVDLSASPSSAPGDHAIVTGHVLGYDARGLLIVESPTGPIQLITSGATTYKVGDAVQVRTTVRSAS